MTYRPVDRRWLMDTIGVLWLLLAITTVGLFFIIEWTVYDIVDWTRRRTARRARLHSPSPPPSNPGSP